MDCGNPLTFLFLSQVKTLTGIIIEGDIKQAGTPELRKTGSGAEDGSTDTTTPTWTQTPPPSPPPPPRHPGSNVFWPWVPLPASIQTGNRAAE